MDAPREHVSGSDAQLVATSVCSCDRVHGAAIAPLLRSARQTSDNTTRVATIVINDRFAIFAAAKDVLIATQELGAHVEGHVGMAALELTNQLSAHVLRS